MKKIMILLVAMISSIAMMAQTRQMKTSIPSSAPTVNVTINGQTTTVKPTALSVSEKDSTHIQCVVSGTNNSKASVTLPISFDVATDLAYRAVNAAYDLRLIPRAEYEKYMAQWKKFTER